MATKLHSRTHLLLGLLGAFLAMGSLAAGILVRGEAKEPQSSSAGAPVKADAVTIEDFKYGPVTVELKAGTKLTFVNDDTAAHTATADSFDTGSIPKGQKKTVTLKKAGTVAYICAFHPYMKGTVVVK